jgi:hypothetical protein
MSAADWADIVVTAGLGLAAFWVGNSLKLRRRTELEVVAIGKRWAVYEEFWSATKPAAPIRSGVEDEILSPQARSELHTALADWWFDKGGGMVLGEPTRSIYFAAKHNLVCDLDELEPRSLREHVTRAGDIERARSELSIRELSLLRTAMRADLGIVGRPYGRSLEPIDREFLRHAGARLWERPWWTGDWRTWVVERLIARRRRSSAFAGDRPALRAARERPATEA